MKFNKTLLISILLLGGWVVAAYAQVGEQRYNFSVGVNGGININSVSFSPSVQQGSLMAPTGGITLRYISEKYFGMICGAQLELNYSQQGWSEFYEDYPDLSYTRKMNYVEIPFLAHIAYGRDKGMRIFLNLGPQIGFLVNDKRAQSGNWEDVTEGIVEQHEKRIENRFDYGITGGLGAEYRYRIYPHGTQDRRRCCESAQSACGFARLQRGR